LAGFGSPSRIWRVHIWIVSRSSGLSSIAWSEGNDRLVIGDARVGLTDSEIVERVGPRVIGPDTGDNQHVTGLDRNLKIAAVRYIALLREFTVPSMDPQLLRICFDW